MSKNKITLLCGTSIDGKLNFGSITSSRGFEDNLPDLIAHPLLQLRRESDAVVVGINTALLDNPRLLSSENTSLKQVVIDSNCHIPLDSNLVCNENCNLIIVTTTKAPKDRIRALRSKNVTILTCGHEKVDLVRMVEELSEMGITKLMLEGGGRLIFSFLKESLIDEIRVVTFPFIVGDKDAVSLANGEGFNPRINFFLQSCDVLAQDYIISIYKPSYENQ